MIRAIVNSIRPGSISDDLGISAGDEIISISGEKPADLIDYQFMTASGEFELHIKRLSGEEEIIEIEKDPDEDLGITFESAVFDRIKPCTNKCMFCFVDQQPDGLRESLYVKDDDYRLSFLQGTYITATNFTDQDRERIEKLKLGPLYISVHTTNPELRIKMLKNPKAGNILKELIWLDCLEIPVHTQIVLCPDINDKEELDATLADLAAFNNVKSIAVVPLGLTRFRNDKELRSFTAEEAGQVIAQIEKFNKKAGYTLAFPSDEFYLLCGQEIPDYSFYGEFGQLDDGVGSARTLLEDFEERRDQLPEKLDSPLEINLATGKLACEIFKPISEELNGIENLNFNLIPVESDFWGKKVTVAGLITGIDLIKKLLPLKSFLKNLFIPSVMLRKYTDKFLDNLSIAEVEQALGVELNIIENYYSMQEVIDFILEKSSKSHK